MLENNILKFKKGSLILLSGLPGSGKSTFIKNIFNKKGLNDYVISSDELRDRYFGILNTFNSEGEINKTNDQQSSQIVFDMMKSISEYRLKNKLTTVIDAMNLNDHSRKFFVEEDWEEIYTIVFDETKAFEQNKLRNNNTVGHRVPDEAVLGNIQNFQKDTKIPRNIIIQAEDILDIEEVFNEILITEDESIVVIGDSHGLKEFEDYIENIEKEYKEKDKKFKLVILGDIVDRGAYSIENLIYLMNKSKELDITVLKGNHDDRLLVNIDYYIRNKSIKELIPARYKTIRDLIEKVKNKEVNLFEVKNFINGFKDCLFISKEDNGKIVKKYFLSHAPFILPNNYGNIRSVECVYGLEIFKHANSHKLGKDAKDNFIKAMNEYSKKSGVKYIFGHVDFTEKILELDNK